MMYKSIPSFLLNENDINTIFKYNANAKYLTKDLKGGYNSNNFSLLYVYLDEKGTSVKIQLPNIFKDHHIVAQPRPTTVVYDEWPLSLALWRKFYDSQGKDKPELNKYFHMYRCKLTFAFFPLQVQLVFLGNTSIIQTCLYALFIDFTCIFMYY